ncbi:hypothetical protein Q7P37_005683 [Cladosporium fusiforme]
MLFAIEILFAFLLPLVAALKFDIQAHPGHESASKERCIRNFVAKDQLVVVTATVSGSRGDGQTLNMHIKDAVGNDYGRPRDVVGESRHAFHAHADTAFDVCFENILTATHAIADPYRNIELDIDIGADAKDWNAIQAGEKLKPVEAELKRVSEVASEIVAELDYLRGREIRLRDTNESTNERVKWFAICTMGMLMALGAWQIVYLRAFKLLSVILIYHHRFDSHAQTTHPTNDLSQHPAMAETPVSLAEQTVIHTQARQESHHSEGIGEGEGEREGEEEGEGEGEAHPSPMPHTCIHVDMKDRIDTKSNYYKCICPSKNGSSATALNIDGTQTDADTVAAPQEQQQQPETVSFCHCSGVNGHSAAGLAGLEKLEWQGVSDALEEDEAEWVCLGKGKEWWKDWAKWICGWHPVPDGTTGRY